MPRIPNALRHVAPCARAIVLLSLAGCAAYNRGIASIQLEQSPELYDDQTDMVDGTYKGLVTQRGAAGPGCPVDTQGTLEIGDHTLFLAYSPSVFFISFVQPDGAIGGQAGDTMLAGHLTDGRLQLTVTSPSCSTEYDFRYVI